ncbi:heme o synthase [Paenibacillus senegalensis]|uniref:heme o synthase n=1 Tax=Paenibacillus senegalensis TaxID=1465766 RepID=UPI0002891966|nr:heme o synthase [Paenibacillus senegalensis]
MDNPVGYTNTAESTQEASKEAARSATWRDFVSLAKPGILFSNSITTFGGFWIASQWNIHWPTMIWVLIGTILVMASGCVLNNYLDRDLDIKMERTKNRALPSGVLQPPTVMVYGIVLGVAGLTVLGLLVNVLAALLGLFGLFGYVWIYTALLKRSSVWNTTVGAVFGAVPPVIGYVAVAGTLDTTALILFAILFFWQPPHFWALGIRRIDDYRNAGYQMLPVVKGTYQTKLSMMRYIVPLVPTSMLLYFTNNTGTLYLLTASILGLIWIWKGVQGFKAKDETLWAKKMFVFSINYLTILFIVMIIDTVSTK